VIRVRHGDQPEHPVITHSLDVARLVWVIGSPQFQRGAVELDNLSNGLTLKQDKRRIVVVAERDQFRPLSVVTQNGVVG
jgi:hypothetical protein